MVVGDEKMADREELKLVSRLRDGASYSEVLIDDSILRPNARRESLPRYVSSMWKYRHFIVAHSRYKSVGDTDDLFLGKAWNILEPLLRIAMYGFLFGLILNTSRGIPNFIGFLVIGITYFSMMSRGLSGGAGLLQRSRSMIGTFRFPRATVVVGETLKGCFASLAPASLAILAALAFQWGEPLSWTIVLVIPLLGLINVFAFGLMLISARITAFLPDAKKIVFFINRAWFYISGIFFSIERFNTHPEIQSVMLQNPAYRFLQAVRGSVMYGDAPTASDWAVLCAWSFGAALIGFVFFWRAEARYVYMR